MRLPRVLMMLMRISGTIQIIVGIALWTGHWRSIVGLHMNNGIVFVLLLFAIALTALVRRRAIGLAVFAIAWGVLVGMFGFSQQRFLVGDLHWIVRVAHLAVGLTALGIAERLTRAASAERATA